MSGADVVRLRRYSGSRFDFIDSSFKWVELKFMSISYPEILHADGNC